MANIIFAAVCVFFNIFVDNYKSTPTWTVQTILYYLI